MPVLFLLAALASFYFVARKKVETAFLAVYLPSLLLLPNEYAVRIPHLPSLSVAQAALVPIGLVACFRFLRAGLPAAQDLLVLAFMVSLTISEVFREWIRNDGILLSVSFFISIFMAYMVGRNLIEPNLRIPTVRRFVFLILLLGPMCLLELRLQQNFYGMIAERFLGSFQIIGLPKSKIPTSVMLQFQLSDKRELLLLARDAQRKTAFKLQRVPTP